MARRALFIGLGGSGGTTLRHLWRELETQLRMAGWKGEMPEAWQFLNIDVEPIPEWYGKSLNAKIDYFSLTQRFRPLDSYIHQLHSRPELVAHWKPELEDFQTGETIRYGRALDRVLTLCSINEIKERIQQLLYVASSPDSNSQLEKLNSLIGQSTYDIDFREFDVWLVTSLAGSLGSASFLDISAVLRSITGLERHSAILYAPDMFEKHHPFFQGHGMDNTLAALSELLNVSQTNSTPSASESSLLKLLGISNSDYSMPPAPDYTFVQGRRYGGVTFETLDELYRSTAQFVAVHTLNQDIRSHFKWYLTQDQLAIRSVEEFTAFGRYHRWPLKLPVSAMSYAKVSLGRSAFADFGAQRLSKLIVKLFDEPSVRLGEVQEHEQLTKDFRTFLEKVGLTGAHIQEFIEEGAGTRVTVREITDDLKDLNQPESFEYLRATLETRFTEHMREESGSYVYLTKEWIQQRSEQLVNEMPRTIASYGAGVALEFLRVTENELREFAQEVHDSPTITSDTVKANAAFPAAFAQGEARQKSLRRRLSLKSWWRSEELDHSALAEEMFKAYQVGLSSNKKNLNSMMLLSLAEGVVAPLRAAIEEGCAALNRELNADPEVRRLVNSWPDDEPNESQLLAKNEFIIQDVTGPEGFSSEFRRLVEENVGQDGETSEQALTRALAEVLSGIRADQRPTWRTATQDELAQASIIEHSMFSLSDEWSDDGERSISSKLTKATFTFEISIDRIINWSNKWMHSRRGVEAYVNESLASYLGGEGPQSSARRQKFIAAFSVAVESSKPTSILNPRTFGKLHPGKSIDFRFLSTQIPLAVEHVEDRQAIATIVSEHSSVDAQERFDPSSKTAEIHLVWYLDPQVHPATMNSLMSPLAPLVRDGSYDLVRDGFYDRWNSRRTRTRTLTDFIPIARPLLVDFAKGWILGRMLGIIDNQSVQDFLINGGGLLPTPAAGGSTKIEEGYFPKRLLTTVHPERGEDLLPAILESMILAFVELSNGNENVVNAYRWLVYAGQNAQDLIAEASSSNPELRQQLLHMIDYRLNDLNQRVNHSQPSSTDDSEFTLAWEFREVLQDALREFQDLLSATNRPTQSES